MVPLGRFCSLGSSYHPSLYISLQCRGIIPVIVGFFFFSFLFLLCWVFIALHGLFLVVVCGLFIEVGLLLWSTGSVVVVHGPSCSMACEIFLDQGLNPCPLHWQAGSHPLSHQQSPVIMFYICSLLNYEFLLDREVNFGDLFAQRSPSI